MRRRRIIERSSRARVNLSRRRARRRRSPRVRLHFLIYYSLYLSPKDTRPQICTQTNKKRDTHVRVSRALPLSSLSVLFTLREQLLSRYWARRRTFVERVSKRGKKREETRAQASFKCGFFTDRFFFPRKDAFCFFYLALLFFCDLVRTRARLSFGFSGHRSAHIASLVELHHEPTRSRRRGLKIYE